MCSSDLANKERRENRSSSISNTNYLKARNESVSDEDLMSIFERTYGKLEKTKQLEPVIRKAKLTPEEINYRSPHRNIDYKGPEYILIDGYNLIHSWDKLKAIALDDFGAASKELIDILCNYRGFRGDDCYFIAVFDAYKVKGNRGRM